MTNDTLRTRTAIFNASTSVAVAASVIHPCAKLRRDIRRGFLSTLNDSVAGEHQMHADAAIPPHGASTAPPAEVVLRNAHIITVDGHNSIAQAIAIAG